MNLVHHGYLRQRQKKVTGVTRKSKLYALQFKNHDNHNQQKGANNNSLNIQIKEGSQKSKVNSYHQGFHFEVVLVVIFLFFMPQAKQLN